MLLNIHDRLRIEDIQDKFNECFPFLKIEFYDVAHKWKESTSGHHLYDPHIVIGDIRKKHDPAIFEIKSWHITGEVEQQLKILHDLNVQIFRRDNDRWIQTSESDHLSLQTQSQIAEASILRSKSDSVEEEVLD